jgi:hypothetical protein
VVEPGSGPDAVFTGGLPGTPPLLKKKKERKKKRKEIEWKINSAKSKLANYDSLENPHHVEKVRVLDDWLGRLLLVLYHSFLWQDL